MELHELINTADPAMPIVREWTSRAVRPVEILPPSANRDDVLLKLQVTTRSPMGAISYETGGVLVDHGWLRILGSGHKRLTRTLPGWNANRGQGFCLIADDAIGGFFAINAGRFGADVKKIYYFAPDSLRWEPLNIGYSAFLQWIFTGPYDQFCENFRWAGWETETTNLQGDRCFMIWPPPWTAEGKKQAARIGQMPVEEAWSAAMEVLGGSKPPANER
jgi:hypothetical protein